MRTLDRPSFGKGLLLVGRNQETDIQIRDVFVQIDDNERAPLVFGSLLRFELEPGIHRIRLIKGLTNVEESFVVAAGETSAFNANVLYINRLVTMIAFLLGGAILCRIKLWREPDPESLPLLQTGVS